MKPLTSTPANRLFPQDGSQGAGLSEASAALENIHQEDNLGHKVFGHLEGDQGMRVVENLFILYEGCILLIVVVGFLFGYSKLRRQGND